MKDEPEKIYSCGSEEENKDLEELLSTSHDSVESIMSNQSSVSENIDEGSNETDTTSNSVISCLRSRVWVGIYLFKML